MINWNNPITKGLVLDVPLNEGGGSIVTDKALVNRGTIVTALWANTVFGKALSYAGGATTDSLGFTTLAPTTLRSFQFIFNVSAIDATARRLENWTGCENIVYQTGTFDIFVNWSTTSGQWNLTTLPSLGVWHNMVVTYDGGATTNNPSIYIDNAPQAFTVFGTPSGNLNTATGVPYFGNLAAGNRTWNGYIALARKWNRLLNTQEIQSLSADPWQIYVKPSRNILLNALQAVAGATTAGWKLLTGVGQ